MLRRLVGAWLVLLLAGAAGWGGNPDTLKDSLTLRLEASYVSLDPVEDTGDTSRPNVSSSWSSHEKIVPKLTLGPLARIVRPIQPIVLSRQPSVISRVTHQNKFQYHEVWRI
ncbi:MAG TPA: hypothetical protein VGH22_14815 [Candidatus Binatia bacterium]|jgi:hypothetical protein